MVLQCYKIKLHSNINTFRANSCNTKGVTSVTKSLDLLKILFGNKIVINVKNKSNEKKKSTI